LSFLKGSIRSPQIDSGAVRASPDVSLEAP
jgi:hypothetical protein